MKYAVPYLKITTWFVILISILALFSHSFDPFYSLEGLILQDIYGDDLPDEEHLIMYRFSISLFALISIVYGSVQLYAIQTLITKGDSQFIRLLFMMILIWVAGCTFLIIKFNTWSYFYSAGGMAFMWLPVLGWMSFRNVKFN